MLTKGEGAANEASFHHLCVGTYIYRAVGGIEDGAFHLCALFNEDTWQAVGVSFRAYPEIALRQGLRTASLCEQAEVGFYLGGIVEKDVEHITQNYGRAVILHALALSGIEEIIFIAAQRQQIVAGKEGASGLQVGDGFHQLSIGQQSPVDVKIVAGAFSRIEVAQRFVGKI